MCKIQPALFFVIFILAQGAFGWIRFRYPYSRRVYLQQTALERLQNCAGLPEEQCGLCGEGPDEIKTTSVPDRNYLRLDLVDTSLQVEVAFREDLRGQFEFRVCKVGQDMLQSAEKCRTVEPLLIGGDRKKYSPVLRQTSAKLPVQFLAGQRCDKCILQVKYTPDKVMSALGNFTYYDCAPINLTVPGDVETRATVGRLTPGNSMTASRTVTINSSSTRGSNNPRVVSLLLQGGTGTKSTARLVVNDGTAQIGGRLSSGIVSSVPSPTGAKLSVGNTFQRNISSINGDLGGRRSGITTIFATNNMQTTRTGWSGPDQNESTRAASGENIIGSSSSNSVSTNTDIVETVGTSVNGNTADNRLTGVTFIGTLSGTGTGDRTQSGGSVITNVRGDDFSGISNGRFNIGDNAPQTSVSGRKVILIETVNNNGLSGSMDRSANKVNPLMTVSNTNTLSDSSSVTGVNLDSTSPGLTRVIERTFSDSNIKLPIQENTLREGSDRINAIDNTFSTGVGTIGNTESSGMFGAVNIKDTEASATSVRLNSDGRNIVAHNAIDRGTIISGGMINNGRVGSSGFKTNDLGTASFGSDMVMNNDNTLLSDSDRVLISSNTGPENTFVGNNGIVPGVSGRAFTNAATGLERTIDNANTLPSGQRETLTNIKIDTISGGPDMTLISRNTQSNTIDTTVARNNISGTIGMTTSMSGNFERTLNNNMIVSGSVDRSSVRDIAMSGSVTIPDTILDETKITNTTVSIGVDGTAVRETTIQDTNLGVDNSASSGFDGPLVSDNVMASVIAVSSANTIADAIDSTMSDRFDGTSSTDTVISGDVNRVDDITVSDNLDMTVVNNSTVLDNSNINNVRDDTMRDGVDKTSIADNFISDGFDSTSINGISGQLKTNVRDDPVSGGFDTTVAKERAISGQLGETLSTISRDNTLQDTIDTTVTMDNTMSRGLDTAVDMDNIMTLVRDNTMSGGFDTTDTRDNSMSRAFDTTVTRGNTLSGSTDTTITMDNTMPRGFDSTVTMDDKMSRDSVLTVTRDNTRSGSFDTTSFGDNTISRGLDTTVIRDNSVSRGLDTTVIRDNTMSGLDTTVPRDNIISRGVNTAVTRDNVMSGSFDTITAIGNPMRNTFESTRTRDNTIHGNINTIFTRDNNKEGNIDTTISRDNTIQGNIDTTLTRDNTIQGNIDTTVTRNNNIQGNIDTIFTRDNIKQGNIDTTITRDNTIQGNIDTTVIRDNTIQGNIDTTVTRENNIQGNIDVTINRENTRSTVNKGNTVSSQFNTAIISDNSMSAGFDTTGSTMPGRLDTALVRDSTMSGGFNRDIVRDNTIAGGVDTTIVSGNTISSGSDRTFRTDTVSDGFDRTSAADNIIGGFETTNSSDITLSGIIDTQVVRNRTMVGEFDGVSNADNVKSVDGNMHQDNTLLSGFDRPIVKDNTIVGGFDPIYSFDRITSHGITSGFDGQQVVRGNAMVNSVDRISATNNINSGGFEMKSANENTITDRFDRMGVRDIAMTNGFDGIYATDSINPDGFDRNTGIRNTAPNGFKGLAVSDNTISRGFDNPVVSNTHLVNDFGRTVVNGKTMSVVTDTAPVTEHSVPSTFDRNVVNDNTMAGGFQSTVVSDKTLSVGIDRTALNGYQSTVVTDDTMSSGIDRTAINDNTVSVGIERTIVNDNKMSDSFNRNVANGNMISGGIAEPVINNETVSGGFERAIVNDNSIPSRTDFSENTIANGLDRGIVTLSDGIDRSSFSDLSSGLDRTVLNDSTVPGDNNISLGDNSMSDFDKTVVISKTIPNDINRASLGNSISGGFDRTVANGNTMSGSMDISTLMDNSISSSFDGTSVNGNIMSGGVVTTTVNGNTLSGRLDRTGLNGNTDTGGFQRTIVNDNTMSGGIDQTFVNDNTVLGDFGRAGVSESKLSGGFDRTTLNENTMTGGFQRTVVNENTMTGGFQRTVVNENTMSSNIDPIYFTDNSMSGDVGRTVVSENTLAGGMDQKPVNGIDMSGSLTNQITSDTTVSDRTSVSIGSGGFGRISATDNNISSGFDTISVNDNNKLDGLAKSVNISDTLSETHSSYVTAPVDSFTDKTYSKGHILPKQEIVSVPNTITVFPLDFITPNPIPSYTRRPVDRAIDKMTVLPTSPPMVYDRFGPDTINLRTVDINQADIVYDFGSQTTEIPLPRREINVQTERSQSERSGNTGLSRLEMSTSYNSVPSKYTETTTVGYDSRLNSEVTVIKTQNGNRNGQQYVETKYDASRPDNTVVYQRPPGIVDRLPVTDNVLIYDNVDGANNNISMYVNFTQRDLQTSIQESVDPLVPQIQNEIQNITLIRDETTTDNIYDTRLFNDRVSTPRSEIPSLPIVKLPTVPQEISNLILEQTTVVTQGSRRDIQDRTLAEVKTNVLVNTTVMENGGIASQEKPTYVGDINNVLSGSFGTEFTGYTTTTEVPRIMPVYNEVVTNMPDLPGTVYKQMTTKVPAIITDPSRKAVTQPADAVEIVAITNPESIYISGNPVAAVNNTNKASFDRTGDDYFVDLANNVDRYGGVPIISGNGITVDTGSFFVKSGKDIQNSQTSSSSNIGFDIDNSLSISNKRDKSIPIKLGSKESDVGIVNKVTKIGDHSNTGFVVFNFSDTNVALNNIARRDNQILADVVRNDNLNRNSLQAISESTSNRGNDWKVPTGMSSLEVSNGIASSAATDGIAYNDVKNKGTQTASEVYTLLEGSPNVQPILPNTKAANDISRFKTDIGSSVASNTVWRGRGVLRNNSVRTINKEDKTSTNIHDPITYHFFSIVNGDKTKQVSTSGQFNGKQDTRRSEINTSYTSPEINNGKAVEGDNRWSLQTFNSTSTTTNISRSNMTSSTLWDLNRMNKDENEVAKDVSVNYVTNQQFPTVARGSSIGSESRIRTDIGTVVIDQQAPDIMPPIIVNYMKEKRTNTASPEINRPRSDNNRVVNQWTGRIKSDNNVVKNQLTGISGERGVPEQATSETGNINIRILQTLEELVTELKKQNDTQSERMYETTVRRQGANVQPSGFGNDVNIVKKPSGKVQEKNQFELIPNTNLFYLSDTINKDVPPPIKPRFIDDSGTTGFNEIGTVRLGNLKGVVSQRGWNMNDGVHVTKTKPDTEAGTHQNVIRMPKQKGSIYEILTGSFANTSAVRRAKPTEDSMRDVNSMTPREVIVTEAQTTPTVPQSAQKITTADNTVRTQTVIHATKRQIQNPFAGTNIPLDHKAIEKIGNRVAVPPQFRDVPQSLTDSAFKTGQPGERVTQINNEQTPISIEGKYYVGEMRRNVYGQFEPVPLGADILRQGDSSNMANNVNSNTAEFTDTTKRFGILNTGQKTATGQRVDNLSGNIFVSQEALLNMINSQNDVARGFVNTDPVSDARIKLDMAEPTNIPFITSSTNRKPAAFQEITNKRSTSLSPNPTPETTVCEVGSRFACKAVGSYMAIPGMVWWCFSHCKNGICPREKCDCSCESGISNTKTEARQHNTPGVKKVINLTLNGTEESIVNVGDTFTGMSSRAEYQPAIAETVGRSVGQSFGTTLLTNAPRPITNRSNGQSGVSCRGINAFARTEGIAEWCTTMCRRNVCPPEICACNT